MSGVYEEFEQELAVLRERYASAPQREIVRLFLLALEREEIVSVGYREEAIRRRLETLPIAEELRDLIHHALLWAWKDEQMHAIYLRGAILKLGSRRLKLIAFINQFAGAIGGWSASVRQHRRWRQAPISRTLATLLTGAGTLTGKVPSAVKQHLRYRTFHDFALFNVEAERTAWLCFRRLIELLQAQPDFDANVLADFQRTLEDEDRHRRVFQIIAAALSDKDELAAGESVERVSERIAEVGEVFLPRSRRIYLTQDNPLGSGGEVFVRQGTSTAEKLPLFNRLLDETKLPQLLKERARALGKSVNELRIAIKANFMLGYHRKDLSVITDPVLLEELARYLRKQGCIDIAVVESRNLYDFFYQNRTIHDVANYFGIASPVYRVVDLTDEQVAHEYARGLGQRTIGRTWKEADFRISFAKMCSHPVDIVYFTLGNCETLGGRCDQFIFAERQTQKETAVMMLLDEFPPHFALLDAYDTAGDGLLGMLSCPRPKMPCRFYAGCDALAVDLVAARHTGIEAPENVGLNRAARHWFGDPTKNIRVIGVDKPVKNWRSPYQNEWTTMLSLLAYPVYVYGSNRGAVFVPEMDEEAFPPVAPVGALLRFRRRSLQRFLGIRHPNA